MRPVSHTVSVCLSFSLVSRRQLLRAKLHFDTSHYNHIEWAFCFIKN